MKWRLLAVALCLIGMPLARAAEPACQPGLDELARQGDYLLPLAGLRSCLGFDTGAGVVGDFNAATPDAADPGKRYDHTLAALQVLVKFADEQITKAPQETAWPLIAVRLRAEIQWLQSSPETAVGSSKLLDPEYWERGDGKMAGGAIDIYAPPDCPTAAAVAGQLCPAYLRRKEIIRVFALAERLRRYAQADSLVLHLEHARLMSGRWSSYFHETLPQYWWEVALNGWRMDEKLCPTAANGNPVGFCEVPESQIVLMHPAAVLQWIDGAEGANDLKAGLAIEIFGYNKWHWDGETPTGQKGIGVVAAYADRGGSTAKNLSYGLIIHYGSGYNLAFTTTLKGKRKFGIFFNTSVAEKLFAQKEKYINYLKALQKPKIRTLLQ